MHSKGSSLPEEPKIPLYIRMSTMVLLARMVDDYDEAFEFHRKAVIALRKVRKDHVKDVNNDVALKEMIAEVEELRQMLAQEAEPSRILSLCKHSRRLANSGT